MKETAEDYLHAKVDKAVITVPAYFNDGQRQATIDAAKIAGLEVLQIINEPTAAALAYGVQRSSDELRKVLVFDFGGGEKVQGHRHRRFLGGEDFVTALMDHCIEEFEKLNDLTVERTSEALQELREECERAKKALSSDLDDQIYVTEFFDDIDLNVYVYRSKFEALCEPLFKRAITLVERTLSAADATHRNMIDEVLLVGHLQRVGRPMERLVEAHSASPSTHEVHLEIRHWGQPLDAPERVEHTNEFGMRLEIERSEGGFRLKRQKVQTAE